MNKLFHPRIRHYIRELVDHDIWSGPMKNGKPFIEIDGKPINVRKYVYKIVNSTQIDKDMVVCRSCKNKLCVRHLYLIHRIDFLAKVRGKLKLTKRMISRIQTSKLPQQQLAEELNVSQSTISRYRRIRTK